VLFNIIVAMLHTVHCIHIFVVYLIITYDVLYYHLHQLVTL